MTSNDMPDEKCPNCGGKAVPGFCPYAAEINDEEEECDCCDDCREDHRGDI